MRTGQIINNSLVTENFSTGYPILNKYMMENAIYQPSRNGDTKELLDFKTTLTNPYKRCVGNNGRNINIFFLMAEAMWIFTGKKDLATLQIFNDQMKEYSDDGVSFHAPYGFRIRSHGKSSFDNNAEVNIENRHDWNFHYGKDQLMEAIEELNLNPESRQIVLQIWDANLDLGTKTKDKPCNDLVFLKIRNGKLITTIANRSNDLHWGLPTNIYQFSFLSEMIGLILGVELGTQTHNSHSLHFYTNNDIAMNMYENLQFQPDFVDLYDISEAEPIDFNFEDTDSVTTRMVRMDGLQHNILSSFLNKERLMPHQYDTIYKRSKSLALYHDLCHVFIDYKFGKEPKTDGLRARKVEEVHELGVQYGKSLDVIILAQNFFLSRMSDTSIVNGSIFANHKL